jgi:hypothetical protein
VRHALPLRRNLTTQHSRLTPFHVDLLGANEQGVRYGELTPHQRVVACQLERVHIFAQPLRAENERPRVRIGGAVAELAETYLVSNPRTQQRRGFRRDPRPESQLITR